MLLTTAMLIAAGISAAAGLAGGAINAYAQKEANDTNIELAQQSSAASALEAQKNRDWQTEMSNTAHQREVADLKAAGLNPYASIDSGGAAVTGGATGQVTNPRVEPVGDGGALANLASTAQSLAFMMALNSRSDANIKSRERIASLNNSFRSSYYRY